MNHRLYLPQAVTGLFLFFSVTFIARRLPIFEVQ